MAGECPGRRSPSAGAKPISKLSLLVGLAESFSSSSAAVGEGLPRSPTPRSPRSFDYDGAVGLGIVAAMNDGGGQDARPRGATVTRTAVPTRSEPIPIVSAAAGGGSVKERRAEAEEEEEEEEEEMELSESYTCVIAHVGGGAVRKRVYFDGGAGGCSAVVFEMPPPPPTLLPPLAEDFLSRCFLCRKELHGVDIFMYRGEKAFCSAECRYQQMVSDEHREKCAPDAMKAFDCCSASPCSTPLFLAAGVAAA